jgi:hypothetical protein
VTGSTYYYRVYDFATNAVPSGDIRTQVKTFADGMVQAAYCGGLLYTTASNFTVERQDIQELYSNPGVKVKGYGVDFTDTAAPSSAGLDQVGTGLYDFSIGNIPGLQGEIPYDVSVRHGLNITANGAVDFYWSDYGTSCVMGLAGTTGGLANDECSGAIDIVPALFGVPAWQTYTRDGATQSLAGCQGTADDDVWFSFTAQSSNDYIVAQSVGNSFDAVVEVYNACGGPSLGCYNNYGDGAIERVLPGGLVAGQSYVFRVYSAEATAVVANVRVQVKTFADGQVQSAFCGGLQYSAISTFTVERQDLQELYSNPGIHVSGYGVDFTDTSAPSSTGLNQIGTDLHDFTFGDIPGLQGAIPYDVSARHGLNLNANGAVSFYWSDYGTSCVMGLAGGDGGLANDECSGAIDIAPALFGVPAWQTYTRTGATQSLAGCQGTADDDIWFSFTAESSNDNILVQSLGNPFDAVVEVYSACGGTSLGCYNNYGDGAIERVLPGGLIAGQSYVFRVYSAQASAVVSNLRVQVKTFADGMVQSAFCGVLNYDIADDFVVENQVSQELYSSSNVVTRGFAVLFEENGTAFSSEYEQPGFGMEVFNFADVPGVQVGDTYEVSVRHALRISANGAVNTYLSDFGTRCTLGLTGGAGAINPQDGDEIAIKSIIQGHQISSSIYPNPNSGEEFMLSLAGLSSEHNLALVSIYDMLGKEVFKRSYPVKGNEVTMRIQPTQTLEAGMYTVMAIVDGQTSEVKFIIQ